MEVSLSAVVMCLMPHRTAQQAWQPAVAHHVRQIITRVGFNEQPRDHQIVEQLRRAVAAAWIGEQKEEWDLLNDNVHADLQ